MKATFNIDGNNLTANFNPEDIAGLETIAQISQVLAEKAGCSESAIKGEAILVSIDDIDIKQFYEVFLTLNPNWMDGKRKIREIMELFQGKETYWVIEKAFSIDEREIEDKGRTDFRTAVISGNCFLTKDEAEDFRDKILLLIRRYSSLDLQNQHKVLEKNTDSSSTILEEDPDSESGNKQILYFIDFLDTNDDILTKESQNTPYYPGRVFYGLLEDRLLNEANIPEDTCFTNPDTATLVCMLIAEIFDSRGVKFKGVDMQSNKLEVGQ